MAVKVELLQLSPTMSEGTVVKWLVKEGDTVKVGQFIAEIETDKAVMEHETFDAGTVLKILAPAGSKVPVGSPIAILGTKGEDISSLASSGGNGSSAKSAAPPKAEPAKAADPADASAAATEPAAGKAPAAPSAAKPAAPAAKPAAPAAAPAARSDSERVKSSPLARRIAQDSGLAIEQIPGTGPDGRIIRRDVEAAMAGGAKSAIAPVTVSGEVQTLPVSNIRRIIAARLVESKVTIPHFQLDIEVRAERLLSLVEQIRAQYPDVKVTLTHLLIKAMGNLAWRHLEIRTQWAGDSLRILPSCGISVAVATDEGLITVVVKDVQAKGLLHLATETKELFGRARERRLKPDEMSGGVQTISNLGMFPIHFFTAIINPPESSILAIGAIEDRPVVEKGAIVPGKVFTITMSCDHRVIDGAVGAAYLKDLKASLEEPAMLLL